MAKLICEDGDYIEFFNFQETKYDDDELPTHLFYIHVKSRLFSGTGQISTWLKGLNRIYNEIFNMCQSYFGEVSFEDDDFDYEVPTAIKIEYTSRGYCRISGRLVEEYFPKEGNVLYFNMNSPVGNFDSFLPELKEEIDRFHCFDSSPQQM